MDFFATITALMTLITFTSKLDVLLLSGILVWKCCTFKRLICFNWVYAFYCMVCDTTLIVTVLKGLFHSGFSRKL